MMQQVKVVVIGDGAVGKTSMLVAYCDNRFPEEYEPTVFDNYSCSILVDGSPLSLQLWDTAGQEEYDRLRPLSYPQTDCFLVCFSLVNPTSLRNTVTKWLPEIRLHCSNSEKNAKIVLVGTKADLHPEFNNGDATVKRALATKGRELASVEEARALAQTHSVPFVACSALSTKGLKSVFDTAVREVLAPPPLPPKPTGFVRVFGSILSNVASRISSKKRREATRSEAQGVRLQRRAG